MIGTATTAIPAPRSVKQLIKEEYRTGDIVTLVQHVVKTRVPETAKFSRQFTPDLKGLRKLFNWVDSHITYEVDPPENQWVQSPAWLNKSMKGDCKSYTALISTTLTNMGLDNIVRYVSYGPGEFTHVYPVAILGGREIPMDVVWKKQHGGPFGKQKKYHRKRDYTMKGLYQLGSTGSVGRVEYLQGVIGEMETTLVDIQKASAAIPDVVRKGWGDVTQMTGGKVDRMILADRYAIQAKLAKDPEVRQKFLAAEKAMEKGTIAGIYGLGDDLQKEVAQVLRMAARNTAPAVKPIPFTIPGFPPLTDSMDGFFSNLFKKAKEVVKNVADAIGDLFKKFTNWFFKFAAKGIGPFFIFRFLKMDKILSPGIKQRNAEQGKTYEFIKRLGKYDDRQLKGLMLNGILEQTGKGPEQMVQEAGVPQIAGLVALVPVVVKAIEWVINVISKLAGIFKKDSNPGVVNETTMSDPRLLEEEARLQNERNKPADGGGSGLLIPAAAAALLALKFI